MKEFLKKWLGPILIVAATAIVIISGIISGTLPAALAALAGAKPIPIALCVLLYLWYILIDAVSVRSALKSQGYHLHMVDSCVASIKGSYYSNITPGAAGGQPMHVHHLHKKGIPVGAGTSAVMCHFIAQQIMLTVLTTLVGIPYAGFAFSNVGSYWPILVFGYIYNTVTIIGVMLFNFSRRPVLWLVKIAIAIIEKFHLTKDPEAMREKWLKTADTFHDSMQQLKAHPTEWIKQLFFSAIQLLMLMSILYCVYKALGLTGASYGQILMMALCQYISAFYIPMPGASGAQEGVFSLYFGKMLPGTSCLAVMLVWRFMTYYLGLLIGAVVIMVDAKSEGVTNARREPFARRISQTKEELHSAGNNRKKELVQKIERFEHELSAHDRHAARSSSATAFQK